MIDLSYESIEEEELFSGKYGLIVLIKKQTNSFVLE